MKIALAMLTTDREINGRQNYIFHTIVNMVKQGVMESPMFHSLTIHVDGSSIEYADRIRNAVSGFDSIDVVHHTESHGSAGNAQRALAGLSKKNADWAIMLEDDLDFCNQFLEVAGSWILEYKRKDRLVYQLGVWIQYQEKLGPVDLREYFDFKGHNEPWNDQSFNQNQKCELLRGSQCYALKPESAAEFSKFIADLQTQKKSQHMIHHDMRIRQWLNAYADSKHNSQYAYIRAPWPYSFVDHIGKESSVYGVKKHIDPVFNFRR